MAARKTLSIATCNLYNINKPGLPIYNDTDGWNQIDYDKKVAWTSSILTNLTSDVWGFQELWHKDSLTDVFGAAGLLADYDLLVPQDHTGQRIICAGAVRKGILVGDPEWIVNFPDKFTMKSGGDDAQTSDISVQIDKFSRPILHFKIRPRSNGKVISVYVVHFKSKGPTKLYREQWYKQDKEYFSKHSAGIGAAISTIRRTAEAAALRMILTEEMKGNSKPVIVLGDCNDGQHSNTLNIVTEQPNYLLSGSTGGSDTALYTVGTLEEYRSLSDVYYTHTFKNSRESLDHILVSQEFYDNSRKRIWAFKGMHIINDHLNEEKEHKNNGTSDHGIVRTAFEYRPA